MRVLHTSDWHLGQTFHGYDRQLEHQQFLDWLLDQLASERPDVLLIAGDVFDTANPSAAAQKQLYHFIRESKNCLPALQIVLIAGNHDSPGRIEAPMPLLEDLGVQVTGVVKRNAAGEIDIAALVTPLKDQTGDIMGWCLGIPFLRPGDLPKVAADKDPYADGVAALYRQAMDYARHQRGKATLPIIALGHLHLVGGETSELSERKLIVGGSEALPASIFDEELAYVALGHLHLAQRVGQEHIRYSGSPLPMSFSEVNYKHQIVRVDIKGRETKTIEAIAIPRFVELLRLPNGERSVEETLEDLVKLELDASHPELHPFIEVRFRLEQPEPGLRSRVETALAGKPVRLARIETTAIRTNNTALPGFADLAELERLQPDQVFVNLYQGLHDGEAPDALMKAFNEVATTALLEETAV